MCSHSKSRPSWSMGWARSAFCTSERKIVPLLMNSFRHGMSDSMLVFLLIIMTDFVGHPLIDCGNHETTAKDQFLVPTLLSMTRF